MKMKKTILKIAASALCVCAGIVMNPCVSHADNPIDYYHAWEPPFSNLRATEICCIITLESHHYI